MARKSNFEFLIEALSILPWWSNLIVGIASYFLFHHFAQAPMPPMEAGPQSVAPLMLRGISNGLQYIFPMLFGLAAIVSGLKRIRRRNLLERQTGLESIKALHWREFEQLVGEIYRKQGYTVVDLHSILIQSR